MQESRVSVVYERFVDALKEIVNDLEVTEDELKVAGEFLNRMGKAELFTNMLNAAFSMTVVDRRRRGAKGTRPNLEGPYHRAGAPIRTNGVLLEKEPGRNAQFLEWTGRFLDADTGKPIAGGALNLWQADENGEYDHKGFHLRGIVQPNADGQFTVKTIVPMDYSEHGDDPIGELFSTMGHESRRAAHLHIKANAPGYRDLTTQLFVPWSPFLHEDYVERAVTPDLVLKLDEVESRRGLKSFKTVFDIELQREPA